MSEEGVTFACGVDASERAVAERLLAEHDAVILCCAPGCPGPWAGHRRVTGVCCGTEFLKSAVERAQLGREETRSPPPPGWTW